MTEDRQELGVRSLVESFKALAEQDRRLLGYYDHQFQRWSETRRQLFAEIQQLETTRAHLQQEIATQEAKITNMARQHAADLQSAELKMSEMERQHQRQLGQLVAERTRAALELKITQDEFAGLTQAYQKLQQQMTAEVAKGVQASEEQKREVEQLLSRVQDSERRLSSRLNDFVAAERACTSAQAEQQKQLAQERQRIKELQDQIQADRALLQTAQTSLQTTQASLQTAQTNSRESAENNTLLKRRTEELLDEVAQVNKRLRACLQEKSAYLEEIQSERKSKAEIIKQQQQDLESLKNLRQIKVHLENKLKLAEVVAKRAERAQEAHETDRIQLVRDIETSRKLVNQYQSTITKMQADLDKCSAERKQSIFQWNSVLAKLSDEQKRTAQLEFDLSVSKRDQDVAKRDQEVLRQNFDLAREALRHATAATAAAAAAAASPTAGPSPTFSPLSAPSSSPTPAFMSATSSPLSSPSSSSSPPPVAFPALTISLGSPPPLSPIATAKAGGDGGGGGSRQRRFNVRFKR